MKTNIKHIALSFGLAALLVAGCATKTQAQVIDQAYFNIDWQLNRSMGQSFADNTSGWGMNFEGGYNLSDRFSIGGFISYQTNLKQVDRTTINLSPTNAMNTDQNHSLFQLPFGVSGRYRFATGRVFDPYVGVKIGPQFARLNSYYYIVRQYQNTWGVYMSPEIGTNIYFSESMPFGLHVAAYYSYATNKGDILGYSLDGISNLGVRVGIVF